MSFLHARGDVSTKVLEIARIEKFSPRTWRCFCKSRCPLYRVSVFSTHVEMFLTNEFNLITGKRFLHARGDVSTTEREAVRRTVFSPRTWRCFSGGVVRPRKRSVFSTHVEMFL